MNAVKIILIALLVNLLVFAAQASECGDFSGVYWSADEKLVITQVACVGITLNHFRGEERETYEMGFVGNQNSVDSPSHQNRDVQVSSTDFIDLETFGSYRTVTNYLTRKVLSSSRVYEFTPKGNLVELKMSFETPTAIHSQGRTIWYKQVKRRRSIWPFDSQPKHEPRNEKIEK